MSIALTLGVFAFQGLTIVESPKADETGVAAEYRRGVCRASVYGKDKDGERIQAEFSRRLRDGNLVISLYGPFISEFRGEDTSENHNVTVTFDTGATAPSLSGGYSVGGFSESAWGSWGAGAGSDATYAQLKGATSFSVTMDGNEYGPFAAGDTGAVYAALNRCSYENS